MRTSVRTCVLLLAVLLVVAAIGVNQIAHPVNAQKQPFEITNVNTPEQVPQSSRGEASATVYNPVNQTFDCFAQFTDNISEILCEMVNFTIDYQEELEITVEYSVHENATLGLHLVTFEIDIGYFSYIHQYQLEVIPVATITSVTAGQVFFQGQTGLLLVEIENRVDRARHVRVDTYGVNFTNASQEVDIAPGSNTVVITIQHNSSHFFDFGMCPVNVSLYYGDKLIDSNEGVIPVDMLVLNKVVGVILPVVIFEVIVLYYVFRKMRRSRGTSET